MNTALNFLPLVLVQQIEKTGTLISFEPGQQIIREGQYINVLPIVLDGIIKVSSKFEDKDLLLYYIKAQESCIMSLTAILENNPSRIVATAETSTKAILIPANTVNELLRTYPALQQLFFRQFYQRYNDLLDNIHQLLFQKIDQRVFQYLDAKKQILQQNRIPISHKKIAADLGTAREVVSRALKKLEHEGLLQQSGQGWIEIK